MRDIIEGIVAFIAMGCLLIFLPSCGSVKLGEKSPDRAKSERFYRLVPERPDIIYVRVCLNKKKTRECSVREFNLHDEWGFFATDFILIPYKYVFP